MLPYCPQDQVHKSHNGPLLSDPCSPIQLHIPTLTHHPQPVFAYSTSFQYLLLPQSLCFCTFPLPAGSPAGLGRVTSAHPSSLTLEGFGPSSKKSSPASHLPALTSLDSHCLGSLSTPGMVSPLRARLCPRHQPAQDQAQRGPQSTMDS